MRREQAVRFLILVTLFLGIGSPAYATPSLQGPTPTATKAQADALINECATRYSRSDFRGALEACQAALPLYRQLGDRRGEATALIGIGAIYRALSDYEQALSYFEQALTIQQEIGDWAGEATTLNNIGVIYSALSDYQQALDTLQQALDIRREIGDRVGEATTLNNIGQVYNALSAYQQALEYYQQALDIKQAVGDRAGEATTLHNIGMVYEGLSDYEQALAYLQQVLPVWREVGDRAAEATTLNNIGYLYSILSDYQWALSTHQQALTIQQEIGDRKGEAATLNNIGLAYGGLSDYQQALSYLQQALDIVREIGDRQGEAAALSNIGAAHHSLSDYGRALSCYQQALPVQQEIGDRDGEATTLNRIGQVYGDLSDYDQALAYYQQALDIRQEIGDWRGEAATLNNIGVAYQALSDYEQALSTYQQALTIKQEIGDRRGEARTLSNIGEVYYYLSDYEQALSYFEQALTIEQEIGDRAAESTTLNNIGVVYSALSNYEQAVITYQQALSMLREIGDRAGQARTLGNLAVVYEAQGQGKQALEYILQAVEMIESIQGGLQAEALQTSFAAGKTDYYHYAVRLFLAQGQADEALHYAERSRARTLLTLLGNQHVDPKGSEDSALIEREGQLHGELAALERQLQEEQSKPTSQRSQQVIEHVTANLEARRQEYKELLTKLQLTNPEYADLVRVDPLPLEEIQVLLREQSPDVTLVVYFVGDEETAIFVLDSKTLHAEALPVSREELSQQTEALLAQMKAAPLLPDAWQEPAQTLHEWLVAPVQEYLPPANSKAPPRLGIVPYDLLHYLPFGLLYDGENRLLDGYTLFYAPSISSLQFIFKKRHPQANTLLALANPDVPGAPHLRHAVEETRTVAALYGTQPLIGVEASEGHFKAQAGQHGLVHIAAHGDYNPHSPLFSAILLQADEDEDGRLETHEVFNLDLPQTDLVVLSACETHLGELSGGDELVGLERAFVRAGAPSLLTTLWPVDDVATAELMERFYTHLRAGVPKAEALRLAQLKTRAEHPEPYYWAGFVLVGDCGKEPLSTDGREELRRWLPWAGIGLAIVLGGAVVFWWQHRRRGPQ